jgi:hypothetical protein
MTTRQLQTTSSTATASTTAGGIYNPASINFYLKATNTGGGGFNYVRVGIWEDVAPTRFYWDFNSTILPSDNRWRHFSYPIGTYRPDLFPDFTEWTLTNAPDWANINGLEFYFRPAGVAANQCDIWLDGLNLMGHVVRGAKKLQVGGAAEDYYKFRLITDDVAKDDTLATGNLGTSDVGTMGRLAHAELLRSSKRPITGQISVPGLPTILPGQFAHIHAAHTTGATYRINKDMRIFIHKLEFFNNGLRSYLNLTDDIYNGNVMRPYTMYNLIAKAVNPDNQDRQIASIKSRLIDITLPILEESYQFSDVYP